MLKKFLDGLIFGSGVAIAFVVVWVIWMSIVIPRVITSFATTETKQPVFENPREAKVAEPSPSITPEKREFSFSKYPDERMKIPPGGGILAMSTVTTNKGSKRPSTYQLWLTGSKLLQIRTNEEKAEVEELPYPKDASVADIDKLMSRSLGTGGPRHTTTVSAEEISQLKSTGNSFRDDRLNGKLKITVEGIVFILPNPY